MNSVYELSDITVGVKTFGRAQKLALCLESLVDKGFKEVIVADDGEINAAKKEIYSKYSDCLPLNLVRLPFDTGLAQGRNDIVDRAATEYLLMLDDDQAVPDNVGDLKRILASHRDLGGVSGYFREYGKLICDARDLSFVGSYVVKDIKKTKSPIIFEDLQYSIYDFIPNGTLFKTVCLREISWDAFYKIGSEHLDFYLRHKRHAKWKFAVTPNVEIDHFPKRNSKVYFESYRFNEERLQQSLIYCKQKWGFSDILMGRRHLAPSQKSRAFIERMVSLLITLRTPPRVILAVQSFLKSFIIIFKKMGKAPLKFKRNLVILKRHLTGK